MSHLVETMAFAGEAPWHGLGTPIPKNTTAREILAPAGLDWRVGVQPCFHHLSADAISARVTETFRAAFEANLKGRGSAAYVGAPDAQDPKVDRDEAIRSARTTALKATAGVGGTFDDASLSFLANEGAYVEVPRFRTTVRSSDRSALGIVSEKYGVIQNAELAALADAIAGEGNAWCHTAGSLDEGRRVWFLMQIPGQIWIEGDASPIDQFFLLNTRHDGTAACRLQFTPVRVVCNNTLTMAIEGGKDAGFSLRHSENVADHLETARDAMASAVRYYEGFRDVAGRLARATYTAEQVKALAEYLFPGREDGTAAAITVSYREAIQGLFDGGKGHAGIRGTAWAAVNAVAEFVDHGRNHRATPGSSADENRTKAIWFGSGVDIKKLALQRVLKDAGLAKDDHFDAE